LPSLHNLSFPTLAAGLALFTLVVLSERYWFLQAWRWGAGHRPVLRVLIRCATVLVFGLLALGVFLDIPLWRPRLMWRSTKGTALAGLWILSALLGYLAACLVEAIQWFWPEARPVRGVESENTAQDEAGDIQCLQRRRFVLGAATVAAALPFAGAAYGFLIGRRRFYVREVSLRIAGLPPALDGMRITQLSDLHMSAYFSAADARRAVAMANELRADVTVVTGDFITAQADPLEACIAELSQLEAPLGVWGCNGNHEQYTQQEAKAARLFDRYGMVLLRTECSELVHHGQGFNLIGVDYQPSHYEHGRLLSELPDIKSLVRSDVPNILLSHNPNTFPAAAELGIQLSLAGHTHGGQVSVEILHRDITPARFYTPYVAGAYQRPLGCAADLADETAWAHAPAGSAAPAATIYVNRGLGTIGAPVRIGVPPEITHFTLRRA
jgi:predicted MPP superfamily phosphohydrolase